MNGLDAYFADEHEIRDEFWHPTEGDVVIDVGSAEGSYTIPALDAGARVIAVEPFQHRLDTLIGLAAERGASDRLIALREALHDGHPIPDALMRDLHAAAPITSDMAPAADVPWSTLDDLAERFELDHVDWIKIDAEGAECGIVRGGLDTLRRFAPRVLLEDHTAFYPSLSDGASALELASMFDDLAYTVDRRDYAGPTSGPRTMWLCTPPDTKD